MDHPVESITCDELQSERLGLLCWVVDLARKALLGDALTFYQKSLGQKLTTVSANNPSIRSASNQGIAFNARGGSIGSFGSAALCFGLSINPQ